MSEIFTDRQVRQHLKGAADEAGGVSAWARARGFTPQYVHGVIGGLRPLSPRILGELGFERVIHYVSKEKSNGTRTYKRGRTASPRPGAD